MSGPAVTDTNSHAVVTMAKCYSATVPRDRATLRHRASDAGRTAEADITAFDASAYACRRRNNASSGKMSEHAFANALDISTLIFGDGQSGAVPAQGSAITVSYLQAIGDQGNLGPNRITQLLSPVYLNGGQVVQITGLAQTNERVSELLRNTLVAAHRREGLEDPHL